jgi:hypothetical protein
VRRYWRGHLRRRGGLRCDHAGTGDGFFATFRLPRTDSQASGRGSVLRGSTGISARRVCRLTAGPPTVLCTCDSCGVHRPRRHRLDGVHRPNGVADDIFTRVKTATGSHKAEAVAAAVEGPLTASCRATVLQLRPHVTVVVDDAAAAQLKNADFYRCALKYKPAQQKY